MDRSLIGYPGRHSPGAAGPAELVAHIPESMPGDMPSP